MNIKDEAVVAAAEAIKNGRPFRHAETARAALTAALPHMGGVSGLTVSAAIKDALRELDNVTAISDEDANCLGCAENLLRQALDALSPAPVGVTDGMVDRAWRILHGDDSKQRVRLALSAALASHEPAPAPTDTDTQERKELGYDAHGNLTTFNTRDDDTQAGMSEAGEVVGWSWSWGPEGKRIYDAERPNERQFPGKYHDLSPLVRQSALTACQQEVEKADANAMAWGAELKSAKARILELEADLEVANDKLRKMVKALASVTHQLRGWQPEEVALDSDLMEDAPAIERALRVLGRTER